VRRRVGDLTLAGAIRAMEGETQISFGRNEERPAFVVRGPVAPSGAHARFPLSFPIGGASCQTWG
jgi:hypothetical protein